MSRLHIFDILNQEINFREEYNKLQLLVRETLRFNGGFMNQKISVHEVIELNFRGWKNRGTSISLDETITQIATTRCDYSTKVFLFSELLMNLVLDKISLPNHNSTYAKVVDEQVRYIMENIQQILARTGYCWQNIEGKIYILENNSAATAVTEITNDSQVLEYNHFALKGNLTQKMAIINHLYKNFEPKRKSLEEKEYKSIYDDYAFLANTFSRHNSDESLKILQEINSDIECVLDYAYDLYLTVILIDNYLRG